MISEVVKKVVSTERVSMEDNTTRSEELDIYKVTYPLYAIYLKIFLMLVATILMSISSVMVILTILKDKKLRSVNNLFIVNLLFTDLVFFYLFMLVTQRILFLYTFLTLRQMIL